MLNIGFVFLVIVFLICPAVAGTAWDSSGAGFGVRLGVCDWTIGKSGDPGALGLAGSLGLENWLSAGDNLRILERVGSPAVRVYYDVGNSQDAGHPIFDEIRLLGAHIVEFHAKDTKDLYGKGSIDFPAVRKAMEDIGYNGWFVIEGTKMPLGVEKSVRYDADYLKTVFGQKAS